MASSRCRLRSRPESVSAPAASRMPRAASRSEHERPFLVVVLPAAHDELPRHPVGDRVQDVAVPSAQAVGDEECDVGVSALFTQQGARMPEPRDGLVRPRQGLVGREQRAAVGRCARGGLRQQVGGRPHRFVVGHSVPPQRGDGGRLPGAQCVGGAGRLPCRGQCPCDVRGGEVVEHGGDDLSGRRTQRSRSGREVAHPEPAQPDPVEGGPRTRVRSR